MYKKILVPLDGSTRAEAILPHVITLAAASNAEIILMQVIEPIPSSSELPMPWGVAEERQFEFRDMFNKAETYLNEQAALLKDSGITVTVIVAEGPIAETISSVAEHNEADLIAIASHGRGGLEHVFYGSVASGVLNRAVRPLLVIRSR